MSKAEKRGSPSLAFSVSAILVAGTVGACGVPGAETVAGSTSAGGTGSTLSSWGAVSSGQTSLQTATGFKGSGETGDPASSGTASAASEGSSETAGEGRRGIRIATWNIQGLGAPGSAEYVAASDVLQRLDADVVGLNEIDAGELENLADLGNRLGYAHVLIPPTNPFGTIRNAILSRLAPDEQIIWTAAELSGDPGANDVTRNPLSMTVRSASGTSLTVVVQHWNSGFGDAEEFLRAVDSVRVAQVAARVKGEVVVVGDINAQLGDAETPGVFLEIPESISYLGGLLGSDIEAQMSGRGLRNDAFSALLDDLGMESLLLTQADGNPATRDASGRRIDYILVTSALYERGWSGEVYDARDDILSKFEYSGEAPPPDATELASDHFPVVADIAID